MLSYRPDSLYCGKWGKTLKAYSDLDLDPTMLNIEPVLQGLYVIPVQCVNHVQIVHTMC